MLTGKQPDRPVEFATGEGIDAVAVAIPRFGSAREQDPRPQPAPGLPRTLETVAAVASLGVALPLLLAVTLLLLVTHGRPLLFSQTRGGLGNRPIIVLKLRTMADLRDREGLLLPDDRRLTPVGRAVRRLRLDELPQLLSVLRGDMALVGPRPLLPETVASFGPSGLVRASVPPGLTGWAQVNGNTRLSDDEKLALDLWYVRHRSWKLDLRILLLTVVTLLRGERVVVSNLRMAQAERDFARAGCVAIGGGA